MTTKVRNIKTGKFVKFLMISASALVLSSVDAIAQDSEATDEEASQPARGAADLMMNSITVTARKREESLDDLPLSVSAFTSDSLEARGVAQIDSLAQISPNITFQNNPSFGGSNNSAAIRIRGIGASDFTPTTDPGVGLYVDGVYFARSVGSILDIVEFDRVEVLRGPQGTLFGRNTIGGAINILTARPDSVFGGKLNATYGTDNQLDLQGSMNVPITEELFAKISAGSFTQDGYVKRTDGTELGDDNTLAGRFDLRWEPSSNFTADFSLDASRDRENGPPLQLIDIRYGFNTIDPNTPPFVFFNNIAATLGGAVPNPLPPGPPPPECATEAAPISANPLCYDDRYIGGADGINQGTAPAYSDSDIWGASLNLEWDVNEWLTTKSISSYRSLEAEFARDGDHSPLLISQFYDELEQEQVSQEFQLLGDHFDGDFNWIIGLYYFKEEGFNENNLDFIITSFRSGGDFEAKSLAAFTQGTWNVTDRFHVTAGLRWTEDERSFTPDQEILTFNPNTAGFLSPGQQFIFQPGTPPVPSVEATRKIDEVTPMINLSYDVTDNLLVYGLYSQGFKSGGFTQRVLPPLVPGITCSTMAVECIPGFDPEYVDVYEAGFRFASDDNRIKLSGAGYYTDYSDLQVSTFTSVAPVTQNAAEATIQGFELELQTVPMDSVFIEASIGYTDAEYENIDPSTRIDVAADFERVSKWSANLGASYDFEMGSWVATPRIDWSYRSSYFNDAFNSVEIEQEGFSLVDMNVAFRNDDGLTVTFGMKNVTDEQYLATGVFGDAFSLFEGVYDRGRQAFVRLGYEY